MLINLRRTSHQPHRCVTCCRATPFGRGSTVSLDIHQLLWGVQEEGEKKGRRRCAPRKLEPVLTWLHIKIFLISEREGKAKEPRIRRRSGGRSGSDSSSMAAASCFRNYNERVWRSWLRAKQLRHSRPKCCVDRFRPAWFHSLGGMWEVWCRGGTSGVSTVALATSVICSATHKI